VGGGLPLGGVMGPVGSDGGDFGVGGVGCDPVPPGGTTSPGGM